MKLNRLSIVAAVVLAGAALVAPSSGEPAGTVQLVYHSDTRGYYLPCG